MVVRVRVLTKLHGGLYRPGRDLLLRLTFVIHRFGFFNACRDLLKAYRIYPISTKGKGFQV